VLPDPGPDLVKTAAILLDGVDVVVVTTPVALPAAVCGRLAARARQRGSVLMPYGTWAAPDLALHTERSGWDGLGQGHGRLQCREVTVVAHGRGAAVRPRRTTLWLPKATGLYAQRRAVSRPEPLRSERRLVAVPAPPSAAAGPGAALVAERGHSCPNEWPQRADLAS
jgi:hypothetical protein